MTVSVEWMWRRDASDPLAAPLDDRGRSRRSELGKTRSRVSRLGALRPTGPTALRCLGAQAPAGLWLAVVEAARLWRQRNGWSGNRRLAAYVEPRFGAALRAGIGRSRVCPRVVSSSRSREASFGSRQARSALKSGAGRRGLARGEKSPWAKGRRDPGRGGKVVASAKAPRKGPLRWKASRAARPHRRSRAVRHEWSRPTWARRAARERARPEPTAATGASEVRCGRGPRGRQRPASPRSCPPKRTGRRESA